MDWLNALIKPKPAASLVIRSNAVELAWEQAGKIPGIVRVPVDASEGDAGLVQAIRKALEAAQPKLTRVAVSIPSSDVLVRYFSMPPLPKAELESAIPFEARKYVPFKMDSLVWDCYYTLPDSGNASQNAPAEAADIEIVFAGLPKEGFARFQAILAAVEIQVVAIEPLSQSLARLVASGKADNAGAFDCILELAQNRIQLIIAKEGVPYLTRDIQWSVLQGQETSEMPDSEAQRLLSELRVSMDFFKREHLSAAFTAVTCFGEQEVVLRCIRALSSQLPCPVTSGGDRVSGAALDREIPLGFAPAIGLLHASNRKLSAIPLNFLRRANMGDSAGAVSARPASAQPAANFKPADLLALAKHPQAGVTALLLGASISALLWAAGGAEALKAERQLNRLRAEAGMAGGMAHMDQAALKPIQEKAKEQLRFLKATINQPVVVSEKLDAIVRALPEGVWLTSLTYDNPLDLSGRAGGAAGARLFLAGACFLGGSDRELSAIQELESRLKSSARLLESFGNIRLGKIDAAVVPQQDTAYRVFQLNSQQSSGRL